MKKSNFFWVGYADLMTSLFFVMLVLYVVTFFVLQLELGKVQGDAQKMQKIEAIEKALGELDSNYFEFDYINKRYKLAVDVKFKSNSENIDDLGWLKRNELTKAGKSLYNQIKAIIEENPEVDYLLIIEGNTQKSNGNWISNPDGGYRLSYSRALALYNYWESKGIDFRSLGSQCEVILAGSGYFGYSRDNNDESNNRKFTIQITSKFGKLIDKNENGL